MNDPVQAFSYQQVTTPDIMDDLTAYVFPEMDGAGLAERWDALPDATQTKFAVLAERLEFIAKLEIVRAELYRRQRCGDQTTTPLPGNQLTQVTIRWECEFLDEDFAGVSFDMESLQFYLLATCLDTLAGQPTHKNPFEWIAEHTDSEESISLTCLGELETDYQAEHGLSRLFRALFEKALADDALRKEWLEGFRIVSIAPPVSGRPAQLHPESHQAWSSKTDDQKVKAIAAALYRMRSRFTHTSAREFRRDMPVELLPVGRPQHLVRVGDSHLYEIMFTTVQAAARVVWDSEDDRQ